MHTVLSDGLRAGIKSLMPLRGDLGWSTRVLAVNRVWGLREAMTKGVYTVDSGLPEYS